MFLTLTPCCALPGLLLPERLVLSPFFEVVSSELVWMRDEMAGTILDVGVVAPFVVPFSRTCSVSEVWDRESETVGGGVGGL